MAHIVQTAHDSQRRRIGCYSLPTRREGRGGSFFIKGMSEALAAMGKAATDTEPLAIYYAFKQSELAKEGVVSAGWASFLQAVVDAGLGIDGTWPVRTELSNRMIAKGANALASSIVLICRKREKTATVVTRADFVRALKREMPNAIDDIRNAGVGSKMSWTLVSMQKHKWL